MIANDPVAASNRLAALFERARMLEGADRFAAGDAVRAPLASYLVAQLRMRVGPTLALGPRWPEDDPAHVVLFGGTNTGKSTVLNVLLGRPAAGMGVTARLSQHPEAYRPSALGDRWLDECPTRFIHYRRYRDEHPPRQSDDELRSEGYRPALAVHDLERPSEDALAPPVPGAVFWDAPDYSTEEAQLYMSTLLDVAALADLVLVAVTDESYADDRGHALLRMLNGSGVALRIVANKVPDSRALLDDIARALAKSGQVDGPIDRLPRVSGPKPGERLAKLLPSPEAQAFRAAVAAATTNKAALKRAGLKGAVALIERHWDDVLRPLAVEAERADDWGRIVNRLARDRLLGTYRRDYLEGEQFAEFNRSLLTLMTLLQVPGIGPVLELFRRVVAAPLRLAIVQGRRLLGHAPPARNPTPERATLREGIDRWVAALKAEAQARAATDPAGGDVSRRLDGDEFRAALIAHFETAYSIYRAALDEVIRGRADAMYQMLKQRPATLNALRGAHLAGNALAVGLAVQAGGLNWADAVVGPVVAGLWQNLVHWGLGRYLEGQRAGLKDEQFRAIETLVATRLEPEARAVFQGAATADELNAARDDFRTVQHATARLLGEEEGKAP